MFDGYALAESDAPLPKGAKILALNRATHSQITNLAQAIIKSQTAEIQQMQQWYQAWSRSIFPSIILNL